MLRAKDGLLQCLKAACLCLDLEVLWGQKANVALCKKLLVMLEVRKLFFVLMQVSVHVCARARVRVRSCGQAEVCLCGWVCGCVYVCVCVQVQVRRSVHAGVQGRACMRVGT